MPWKQVHDAQFWPEANSAKPRKDTHTYKKSLMIKICILRHIAP